MAILKILGNGTVWHESALIASALAEFGVKYERWDGDDLRVDADASESEILAAYANEINDLKETGGYVTADVINVLPTTPGLDEMLEKFSKEHWHDEDEVRFILKGRGLFHIASKDGDVVSIEMTSGDLIRIPKGTLHWFDLCSDLSIRAIRLFQDTSGWTPHYTESLVETKYEPACFGDAQLAGSA